MDTKTIVIKQTKKELKKYNKPNKQSSHYLENHISIKVEYLRYFYGCWIKAIHKKSQEYHSGGFLTRIMEDIIYLRNIQQEDLVQFDVNLFTFYVKKTSEQYISMQDIELEKEKMKNYMKKIKSDMKNVDIQQKNINEQQQKLQNDILQFQKIKIKFLKLFEDGKVKILI